ncbi:MAG: protease family protein [Chloroflexota bacterium]|nr:protease family protein [Chloroflexota bacterium]
MPLDSEPPGPITTEEDQTSELEPIPTEPPTGPPGGSIFSLEGRPAAGLYLVAWLLLLAGFAILFMTLLASAEGIQPARAIQPILGIIGTAALGLGFSAAAGYQIVARGATRPPERYRGPSPAICFGVVLMVGVLVSVVLAQIGFSPGEDRGPGFTANLLSVAAAYWFVVWLFVVRSGALTWRDMGWPSRQRLTNALGAIGFGITVAVPSLVAISVLATVVSMLLGGTDAPNVVPAPRTGADMVLIAVSTVLVAPFGEELFFRGFALAAWLRDLGPRSAIIRSAVFFGLVHILNISSVDFGTGAKQAILVLVQILPLGLLLGWLFVRRGILASIAAHATYNGLILLIVLNAPRTPG